MPYKAEYITFKMLCVCFDVVDLGIQGASMNSKS